MPIIKTTESLTMQCRVQVGIDQDSGLPIYRNRNYSRVNPAAVDQDVYDVATGLMGLQIHTLDAIRTVETSGLISE